MRDVTYLIYRHGSNAANQSMTPLAVVGVEVAPDRRTAVERFALRAVATVYANQYLTARPRAQCGVADQIAAQECEENYEANRGRYLP